VKRPGREDNSSPPCSDGVQNRCSSTPTPLTYLHDVKRGNFTFYSWHACLNYWLNFHKIGLLTASKFSVTTIFFFQNSEGTCSFEMSATLLSNITYKNSKT
jgi:hypothetical protein